MLPFEYRAAKTGKQRLRAFAELVGAVETIISALVEIADGDSAVSAGSSNHGDEMSTHAEIGVLQPTIVVCAREDGLTLVNRGRAVFARDYMLRFLEIMAGLMAEGKRTLANTPSLEASSRATGPDFQPVTENCFRRKGMFWTIAYKGKETLVADGNGLHFLARLLRYPGRGIHVLDLAAVYDSAQAHTNAINMTSTAEILTSEQSEATPYADSWGDAGAILDAHAKSAYRRRLIELREELSAAKQGGDEQHALTLEEEIDALMGELRRATGLGGRDRRAASITERARVNVTRTIKLALERIGRVHPELEDHLVASIRTGTVCRYQPSPDEPVTWCV